MQQTPQKEIVEKVARIKLRNNIVDVVGEYVELQKKGSNYKGLCPFHEDTDPSLSVSEEKQIVHCFVCLDKALDVIGFVQKIENISFIEALNKLDTESPLTSSNNLNTDYLKNRMLRMQDKTPQLETAPFPENCIELDSIEKCPPYLTKRINIETIKKFKLLKVEGVFSNFNNRIIIPVYENKELKGFVGRDFTETSTLRYLYPTGWKKDDYIFNFDNIDVSKKLIIVEGLFDAMSLTEKGYTNVISIMGTKLNTKRIRKLLDKKVKDVILCLDMDVESEAGQAATKRIGEQIKDIFNVYKAELPLGKDADECNSIELYSVFSNLKSLKSSIIL